LQPLFLSFLRLPCGRTQVVTRRCFRKPMNFALWSQ
jgi:hypothetical protein